MKRDMDVIRKMLFVIEEGYDGHLYQTPELADIDEYFLNHQAVLMIEAGLVQGELQEYYGHTPIAKIRRLTWEGHDFLDSVRNDNLWSKVKGLIKDQGGPVPFELLKDLVKGLLRSAFEF